MASALDEVARQQIAQLQEAFTELTQAYHLMDIAVHELAVKHNTCRNQTDARLGTAERELYTASGSVRERLAKLDLKIQAIEQNALTSATGRAQVAAAWIGGGCGLFAVVFTVVMQLLQ